MSAYYCVWVSSGLWRARRDSLGDKEAGAALGDAIQLACTPPFVTGDGLGTLQSGGGPPIPCLLEGPWPRYISWSGSALTLDKDPELNFEFVRDLAPSAAEPADIVLFSVDADAVHRMNIQLLGTVIYTLIDHPEKTSEYAGETMVRRGAAIPADLESYLLFYQGVARDPSRLLPSEEADVRQFFSPRRKEDSISSPARLQPVGIGLTGPSLNGEDVIIRIGRARSAILFGKNGAGKSQILGAIENTLVSPFNSDGSNTTGHQLPSASVILQVADQSFAPQQFSLLLAHLAFQPMSDLASELRSSVRLPIRAWNDFTPFDPQTGAANVPELLTQPLSLLQETVAALIGQQLSPLAKDIEPFSRYIATSASVTVATGGRVTLAADPALADADVQQAAERCVAGAPGLAMTAAVYRIVKLAQAITSNQDLGPLPTLGVQLAHCVEGTTVHRESGWLDAGMELELQLRRDLPIPLAYAPGRGGPADLNEVAETAVTALLNLLVGAPDNDEHRFATNSELSNRVIIIFQEEVARVLPDFISSSGRLELRITPPGLWHIRRVSGVFVRLETNTETALDDLPSGYLIWVSAAMEFAKARLLMTSWSGDGIFGNFTASPDDGRVQLGDVNMSRTSAFRQAEPASVCIEPIDNRLLYLLDEPEVHLHLTAQHDVAATVKTLCESSAGALVATHALAFIDTPSESTTIHTLVNKGDGISISQGAGLGFLRNKAEELGVPASALAQLYRGVLLVEGINDIEVLKRYGGVDFDSERVLIVQMQGHLGAPNLAEAEFLHTLKIPLFILLDHVRRTVLIEAIGKGAHSRLYGEERTLQQLHQSLSANRLSMKALPFAGPDIVTAVPDKDVAKLLKARGVTAFAGWKHVRDAADAAWRTNRTKFKTTFNTETGVEVDTLLRDLRSSDLKGRSPHLHGILSALLSALPPSREPSASGLEVLRQQD